MQYSIDNKLVFDNNDFSLKCLATGDELVSLPVPSGRLLDVLLSSGPKVLSRDYLLEEVWDKVGLNASGNNLNQYLSILRKTLANFGCINFILTVPKQGIKINDEIPFFIILQESPDKEVSNESISNAHKSKDKVFINKIFIFTIWLSFLIFIFLFTVHQNRPASNEYFSYKSMAGCNITLLRNFSKSGVSFIDAQINKILSVNKLSCNQGEKIFLNAHTSFNIHDLGRTLLSICYFDEEGEATICDNIYYQNWMVQK
ncbi:TPA: winged helix-turn-helix domain-containing protein [Klebsiella oxytoca]|nr:winged helix-turn-helix domain-containing protein [Klebsiella oxytoca]